MMPDATEKPRMTPKYISEIEGRVRLEMADCSNATESGLDELFRLANVGLSLETDAAKARASLIKEQPPCDHRWHGDYPPFRCAVCGVADPRSYITENEVYRKQHPAPCEHQWCYHFVDMPQGYRKPMGPEYCLKCGELRMQPAPAVGSLTEVDDRLMAECDQWKEQCDNQRKTIEELQAKLAQSEAENERHKTAQRYWELSFAEQLAEVERLRGTIHVLENALEKYVFCRHAVEGCICTKEARTAQSILAEEPK